MGFFSGISRSHAGRGVLAAALFALFALVSTPCAAQRDRPLRTVNIEKVVVEAQRPLSAIGVQRTGLDSAALREDVTNSLADVLSRNSSIFIKSYGRATLSTASFRGTAPSHTIVSWNGMNINSPMLGMVDFSLIPSYFIDKADIYHGAGSTGEGGGGLGGAVALSTRPAETDAVRYIQGVSSFRTLDQFMRLTWSNDSWQFSTRAFYAASRNDFKYTNVHKWEFTYDDNNEIIDRKRPVERNRNGSFNDLHLMQEVYRAVGASRLGLAVWYVNSRRGIPSLNVGYNRDDRSGNRQNEKTLRAALSWEVPRGKAKLSARGGYAYTDLEYREVSDNGGSATVMTDSRNYVHSLSGSFDARYHPNERCMVSAGVSVRQHFVRNADYAIVTEGGRHTTIGYDQARSEFSVSASAHYRLLPRVGVAANLRGEVHGDKISPPIPALFAEYAIDREGTLLLKASAARNYRHPTLNDLYFVPGGNPGLKPEKGTTCDAGIEYALRRPAYEFRGGTTLFDTRITDWILWLPMSNKGLWTPLNVKKVHSYGVELKGILLVRFGGGRTLSVQGNMAVTHSVNKGGGVNDADLSIGKQLMYVPVNSSSVTGRLRSGRWEFICKWSHYGERFATSSNERDSKIWRVSPYYMSDVSLERRIGTGWADVGVKIAVNNLFDEEYESVLSRPMARRNFGIFLDIIPRSGNRRHKLP